MRLAVISDVHADLEALQDALRSIERLGCDALMCAGDLVTCGRFPEQTIALVHERWIPCVRGNNDRWATGQKPNHTACADASPVDALGLGLTHGALAFLAALPPAWHVVLEGVRVAACHGTPRSDTDGIYPGVTTEEEATGWLGEARADILIVGHTHVPFALRALGGGLIVNPGMLLRDGHPDGGTFGVLELPSGRFTVHRASDGKEVEALVATTTTRDRRLS